MASFTCSTPSFSRLAETLRHFAVNRLERACLHALEAPYRPEVPLRKPDERPPRLGPVLADVTKLASTGFTPRFDLASGLEDTVRARREELS